MVNNKKAWLRVVEASISIIIIAGVLFFVYAKSPERIDASNYISDLQTKILQDISEENNLRIEILGGDNSSSINYITTKLPSFFDFAILISEPNEFPNIYISNKEVFVKERIIVSDLENVNFKIKKVRFFVWRK